MGTRGRIQYVREWLRPVVAWLSRAGSLLILLGALLCVHFAAMRSPVKRYSDRVAPVLQAKWAPQRGGGDVYAARPILYQAAVIGPEGERRLVFDDKHDAYERALEAEWDRGAPVTIVRGWRRTDDYGLWFASWRVRSWDVQVWVMNNRMAPTRVRGVGVRSEEASLLARHPGLGGAQLPVSHRPRIMLVVDAIALSLAIATLVSVFLFVWTLLVRLVRAVRRVVIRRPEVGVCGCGYDLSGLASGVCPECGTRTGGKPASP